MSEETSPTPEDREIAVRSLARKCAGLILLAMAERQVDFDYLDIALELDNGTVRGWVDDLTSGRGRDPSMRNLSLIMTALKMRLELNLVSMQPSIMPRGEAQA